MASAKPQFDQFAADYDAALTKGISLSGEAKEFFVAGRMACLLTRLGREGFARERLRVMDFGCGTGSAFECLRDEFRAAAVVGVDVSTAELELARRKHPWAEVSTVAAYRADVPMDLAYSNGTFHHIPPGERAAAVAFIYQALRPGGYFALWENNPWNVGTRWVMSRIAFDRDAVMVWPGEARRLLREAGFEVRGTRFRFIFPRFLSALRGAEAWLERLPLGAQYMVLGRKPG